MTRITFADRRVLRGAGAVALAIVGAIAQPRSAPAQITRLPHSGAPVAWASLGIGYLNPQPINDGSTQTRWAFGSTAQLRGSLELQLRSDAAVGLVGAWSRMPLSYQTASSAVDAHAESRSLMALFRIGGGTGLHQIIELTAGVVQFANFEQDHTGDRLAPERADTDAALAAGYGFGYPLARRLHLTLVQEFMIVIHQNDGLPNDTRRSSQQQTLRLGLRYGLGSRNPLGR